MEIKQWVQVYSGAMSLSAISWQWECFSFLSLSPCPARISCLQPSLRVLSQGSAAKKEQLRMKCSQVAPVSCYCMTFMALTNLCHWTQCLRNFSRVLGNKNNASALPQPWAQHHSQHVHRQKPGMKREQGHLFTYTHQICARVGPTTLDQLMSIYLRTLTINHVPATFLIEAKQWCKKQSLFPGLQSSKETKHLTTTRIVESLLSIYYVLGWSSDRRTDEVFIRQYSKSLLAHKRTKAQKVICPQLSILTGDEY